MVSENGQVMARELSGDSRVFNTDVTAVAHR